MQGAEVDTVTDDTTHDDVGRLAEQSRTQHDQCDARNGQQRNHGQPVRLGTENRAEPTQRGLEVLALLGRHPCATPGAETAAASISTGRGEDGLIVGLIAVVIVGVVAVAGGGARVFAHATAPSPSCDATISAYVGQPRINSSWVPLPTTLPSSITRI